MIEVEAGSLLDCLRQMPDPRSRKGRTYPLWAILTMLVLAALHGERSLRGMWMWGSKHWSQLYTLLDLLGIPRPPVYSTVWEVMSRLDAQLLEDIVARWVAGWAHVREVSVDGKTLCGSRRRGPEEAALQVVTAAGQDLQVVLGQTAVGPEGELESTIRLLRSLPLQGRVVTVDAGLLHRDLVEVVLEQGGAYLGVIKNNEPDVKEMLDDWVGPQISPPGAGETGGSYPMGQRPWPYRASRGLGCPKPRDDGLSGAGVALARSTTQRTDPPFAQGPYQERVGTAGNLDLGQ